MAVGSKMAVGIEDGCQNTRWVSESKMAAGYKMATRIQDGCQNPRWLPDPRWQLGSDQVCGNYSAFILTGLDTTPGRG